MGQPLTATVVATGGGPLTYQWKRNGAVVAGATGATLSIANVALSDRGWYRVSVSNSAGTATSVFVVTVGLAQSIPIGWGDGASPLPSTGPFLDIVAGAGAAHTLALRPDGTVFAWGLNSNGEASVPGQLAQVAGLAAGQSYSAAVKTDGSIVQWGSFSSPSSPVSEVVALSAGRYHTLALKADGTVIAWRGNVDGQSNVPADLRNVVAVAAGGFHSLALRDDGTVVGWGLSSSGEATVPPGLTDVVAISAGTLHSVALRANGTVVAWGQNSSGSTEVPASLNGVIAIAAGGSHTLALKNDGTIVAWGSPYAHQTDVPVGLNGATAIAANEMQSFALMANPVPSIGTQPLGKSTVVGDYVTLTVSMRGAIPFTYQWKRNGSSLANGGRISGAASSTLIIDGITAADAGNYTVDVSNAAGSVTSSPAAVTVIVPPTLTARPRTRLATIGQPVTFSLTATDPGVITYQWKRNGQIIAGATNSTLTIPSVARADDGYYEVTAANAAAAATSVFYLTVSAAPTSGAIVVPWGTPFNSYGQLNVPAGLTDVVVVAAGKNHGAALRADGTVTTWGLTNFSGISVPAGLSDVVAIATTDYSTLALKADGTVISWGSSSGSPPPVPAGLRKVVALSAYETNILALKSDGTVVSWWSGLAPPAGLNQVVGIAAGTGHNLALKSDGTVVGWGGQVSTGAAIVPAGLTNVVRLAAGETHSLALKSDGTVVGWGGNGTGPALVPFGLNNVTAIAGARGHSVALRADGSVVAWGDDFSADVVAQSARAGGMVAVSAAERYDLGLAAAASPTITQQPAGRIVNAGESAILSVKTAGAPLPTLQWRKNGAAISGATGVSLTLPSVQASDAADYTVVASNTLGTVTSNAATLSVVQPLAVTARTLSRNVTLGQPVSLSITATGATSYQWKRNGQIIAGATGSTLTIAAASAADRGYYEVIATGGNGATARAVSYVTVSTTPSSVVSWGMGIGDPPSYYSYYPPADLTDAIMISAGGGYQAALRANGTLAIWGRYAPVSTAGLTGVLAVAAGDNHLLALKSDGLVAVVGTGGYSEQDVPAAATNIVAIAARGYNSMALRADGTVVRWGYDYYQNLTVPTGLTGVVAIAAGRSHCLALKSDGTVTGWGNNDQGRSNVPAGLTGVVAIAAGGDHSMALRSDGSVVIWGNIAAAPSTLGPARAIAGGDQYALVLQNNGSIVAWGRNDLAQSAVPAGLNNVLAIAAGGADSHALLGESPAPAAITTPPVAQTVVFGQTAVLSVAATGTPLLAYQWFKDGTQLGDGGNVSGSRSSSLALTDVQSADAGAYTVRVSNGYGSVTSAPATLTVSFSSVSQQAVPVVGGSVILSVNASPGSTYQWRFRGVPLAGQTNATLALSGLSRAQNGPYDVVLTQSGNSTIAHSHFLDVRPVQMPNLYVADTSFAPRLEQEDAGKILAVLPLPDGKFLVAGDFTYLGAASAIYLARFNANGTPDSSFAPPVFSGPVRALLRQSDGKILVGGDFTFVNGIRSGRISRLNADLTIDATFALGQDFDGSVFALAQQGDGRLLVGGDFTNYRGTFGPRIVRLTAAGARDTTFGFPSLGTVRVIRIGLDGKAVVAGGSFATLQYGATGFVGRLNANGETDATWPMVALNGPVLALRQLADESWSVGGGFVSFPPSDLVVRLTKDGAVDPSFALDQSLRTASNVRFLADGGGGKWLIAGDGLPLSRVTSTGARDATFPALPYTAGDIGAATTETDGAVRLWGAFTAGTRVLGSVTLASGGGAFGAVVGGPSRAEASVFDACYVTGNRILVRGGFTQVNGIARRGLARLNADGTLDSSFTSAATLGLTGGGAMAVQGDGKILVHTGSALIRLEADGAIDAGFTAASYAGGVLELDRDGLALVANAAAGGLFGTGFGARRLTTTGAVASDFTISTNGIVRGLGVQASGRILVTGNFSQINGAATNGFARVLPAGALDSSFPWNTGVSRLYRTPGDVFYGLSLGDNDYDGYIYRFNVSGRDMDFAYPPFDVRPVALFPLPDGTVLRACAPLADKIGSLSWTLGRHLNSGAVDPAFQADGLDPATMRIGQMVMTDDASVWLFGKNLAAYGQPRLGVMRVAAGQVPTIATPPVSVQATPGGTATFSVTAGGSGPLQYQWYRNGARIAGATNATFAQSILSVADVARFTVKVTNAFGSVTSNPVTVTGPNPIPIITTQPVSQTTVAGNPATFNIGATGTGPLNYQWRRMGYPIPGATNASFTIARTTRADATLYDVIVNDGLSLAVSQGVTLGVAPSSYPNSLQVDPSFAPRFETAGGTVNAIMPVAGGKFIVTGVFSRLNGVECPGIARLDGNLQVDPTFTPPAFLADHVGTSLAISATKIHAVLPDGKLLVTRALPGTIEYSWRNTLVRLLPDGAIDTAFVASTEPVNIDHLAIQPDGRVIVAAMMFSSDPLPAGKRFVYRLNVDGSLDASYAPIFTTPGYPAVRPNAIVVQPDGKAVCVGGFQGVNGSASIGLVRLTIDGAVDPTFSPTGITSFFGYSMVALPDGRLVVGGSFSLAGSGGANLIRLTSNGGLDAVLSTENTGPISTLLRQSDGKLWGIAGGSTGSSSIMAVYRWGAGGTRELATTVVSNRSANWASALAGNDRLLVTATPDERKVIVRLGADGTSDGASVESEMLTGVRAAVLAPGGKIYASGAFSRVNGVAQKGLTRLNPDGSRDAGFDVGTGFDSPPTTLVVQGDGKLMVSGEGVLYRGNAVNRTFRIRTDGLLDESFVAESLANGVPILGRMTPLLDGRILMGDHCLLPDGAIDTSFQPATTSQVPEVALSDGGYLAAGPSLTGIGGRVTRMRADGTLVVQRAPGISYVSSLALQPDGKVIVAGAQNVGSVFGPQTQVVRLNANLTTDSFTLTNYPPTYGTNYYFGPEAFLQEDGRIVLNDYRRFARLLSNGTWDSSFVFPDVVPALGFTETRGVRVTLRPDDGSILVGEDTLWVNGLLRHGLVRFIDPARAIITGQPVDGVAFNGGAITFAVSVTSPDLPAYQWLKDGQPITGATGATLVLNNVSNGSAGAYSARITNANGAVQSAAAFLAVQPAVAPVIQMQPRLRSAALGQAVTFSVIATGTPAPAYRWRKDGAFIPGATQASYTIASVVAGDAGEYSVEVSNAGGTIMSNPARLSIVPDGMAATHALGETAVPPGGIATITNQLVYSGPASGVTWQVLLPSGWSVASSTSTANQQPVVGTTGLAEWTWTTPPASPLTFTYVLNAPTTGTVAAELVALVTVQTSGPSIQVLASPDPLILRQAHSADTDRNGRISLLELTRVIELYNTRNGTVRTGCYMIATTASEDGFAPDGTRSASQPYVMARYHSADTGGGSGGSAPDGKLGLLELTRVIELYNYRDGTVRTGQYRPQSGTEDGFTPGPAP